MQVGLAGLLHKLLGVNLVRRQKQPIAVKILFLNAFPVKITVRQATCTVYCYKVSTGQTQGERLTIEGNSPSKRSKLTPHKIRLKFIFELTSCLDFTI